MRECGGRLGGQPGNGEEIKRERLSQGRKTSL